jgi:peptide/nickel transport system ATP-binding protein
MSIPCHPPASDALALDVRGLSVEFPTRKGVLTALSDVSLTIKRGEILGVVGESGAGKSMTGMAVLGLLEPPGRVASGEIRIGGKRTDNLGEAEMASIRGSMVGAIFQDPLTSLNPLFSVGQQLIETVRLHSSRSRTEARA